MTNVAKSRESPPYLADYGSLENISPVAQERDNSILTSNLHTRMVAFDEERPNSSKNAQLNKSNDSSQKNVHAKQALYQQPNPKLNSKVPNKPASASRTRSLITKNYDLKERTSQNLDKRVQELAKKIRNENKHSKNMLQTTTFSMNLPGELSTMENAPLESLPELRETSRNTGGLESRGSKTNKLS